MATEITKNCILVTPLSFEAPCHGTPMNIRMNLMSPENRVRGLHFAADSMCLPSFKFS